MGIFAAYEWNMTCLRSETRSILLTSLALRKMHKVCPMSPVIDRNYLRIYVELVRHSKHGHVKNSQLSKLHSGRWRTPYGTVVAHFWLSQPYSENDSIDVHSEMQTLIGAQIAISTKGRSDTYRIIIDLDMCLNPSARINYQATRPNDSEIFSIVQNGKLEDLFKALEEKTASLTDRDEEGRSLLNVRYAPLSSLRCLIMEQYAKHYDTSRFSEIFTQAQL